MLGAPLHILSKLYDVPVGFVKPSSFEAVYCYICIRRRVAVARYRMFCLNIVMVNDTFCELFRILSTVFSES